MIIRHGRAVSQGKQGLFWGGGAGGLPSQSRLPPQSAAGQRPTGVSRPRRGRQDSAPPLGELAPQATERAREAQAMAVEKNHHMLPRARELRKK